tara:strand:+ start:513 stop:686 length:174 start_codon:yes stop_codon:yes gene_type:complete
MDRVPKLKCAIGEEILPNTQIMSAHLKNDLIDEFRQLNSRDIQKINHRITALKQKIF